MTHKLKVRIQGTKEEVEKLRSIMLNTHAGLILSKPRKGTNPKYDGNQQYASYGDYQFGTIRRRRT